MGERTAAAVRAGEGGGRDTAAMEAVHLLRQRLGARTQGWGEGDVQAAARGSVEDGAGGDVGVEHLFDAEGLRAELDEVAIVGLALAALVLDGEGEGREFDEVGAAGEGETAAFEQQAAHGAQVVAAGLTGQVGPFMQ